MHPFRGSFFGAPTKEGFVSKLQFFLDMPHVENPHCFVTLQVPILSIGTLFFNNLIEFITLFDFHFDINLSLHVKI